MVAVAKAASDKQVALIVKLAGEKNWDNVPTTFDTIMDIAGGAGKSYTTREASQAISELFDAPRKPRVVQDDAEPLEAGFYWKNGDVFQVVISKAGNAYAKICRSREFINEIGEPEWDLWFDYAPGAASTLDISDKMTEDQAKDFGRKYHKCVRCHRNLSRADSIERMMGAVCYRKMGF